MGHFPSSVSFHTQEMILYSHLGLDHQGLSHWEHSDSPLNRSSFDSWESERWFGAALCWYGVVKRQSVETQLSVYPLIYTPTLTCGHKHTLVTERMRFSLQVAEVIFPWRVAGFCLRNGMRSSVIPSIRVEPLLLHIKRSQLRCFSASDSDAFCVKCSRHTLQRRGPGVDTGNACLGNP